MSQPAASRPWHCLAPEAVAQSLATSLTQGLSDAEAARRLASGGRNVLREAPPRPAWRMLLDQFRDFMILMLLAAALVSGAIGEAVDSLAIVAILVVNACIGFVQEYRAAQAMLALKRLAAARARVLRAGVQAEIDAAELVAGDVVLLEAGDLVPADVRLIELAAFEVDEAVLTGESVPVDKRVEALGDPVLGVADRTDLAFKGTVVTRGRAPWCTPPAWRPNSGASPPCCARTRERARPCSAACRCWARASPMPRSPSARWCLLQARCAASRCC